MSAAWRIGGWVALAAVAAFLVVFLLAPVLIAVLAGLRWEFLREVALHPVYRQGLGNSLGIAAVTTLIAAFIAIPLAWLGARCRFPGKALAEGMLMAPLILPPFVGALGVYQVFGRYGALNSTLVALGWMDAEQAPDWLGSQRFLAVCLIEALHLYPFLYLTTVATIGRLDPALLEAARNLGAGPWTRWRRVVLPLIRPGLFAGGIVVFVWSFTELGTPLMLGYDRAMPVQIFTGLTEVHTNPMPFALVVVMLAVATGLYLAARLAFGRRFDPGVGKGGGAGATSALRGWRALAAWAAYAAVVVLAVFPHLAVTLIAVAGDWYRTPLPRTWTLDHFRDALSHGQVVPGVLNSLTYAGAATLLAVGIGGFIAWVVVRWRPPGWRLLDTVAMLPLAVPGIIIAFGFLALVAAMGWQKTLLDPLRDPTLLLVIAYTVRRLPHVVRAAAAGLSQAPVVYEEAAASLGAGLVTRLRRITLPLIAGSLLAGALLTFSFSMLEVSDSLILAQKRDFWPITKVIFELVQILGPGPAIACAFAVWAMLFLAASLACASVFLGRGVSGLLRD